LFGATGALPIWINTMQQLNPVSVPMAQPANVEWQWADKETGLLSAENCSGAVFVPFQHDTLPVESIPCAKDEGSMLNGIFKKVMNWF
jgi:penicillin-binding protein 1B